MGVIAWIVLGAVAGFIAEHLTGRRTSFLLATVIGIVGALIGGLARFLFKSWLGNLGAREWIDRAGGSEVVVGVALSAGLHHAAGARALAGRAQP